MAVDVARIFGAVGQDLGRHDAVFDEPKVEIGVGIGRAVGAGEVARLERVGEGARRERHLRGGEERLLRGEVGIEGESVGEGVVPRCGAEQCAASGMVDAAHRPRTHRGAVGEAATVVIGQPDGRTLALEGEGATVDSDGNDACAGGTGGEGVYEVGGGGAVAAALAGEVDEQHVALRHDGVRVFAPAVGTLHAVAGMEEDECEERKEEAEEGGHGILSKRGGIRGRVG